MPSNDVPATFHVMAKPTGSACNLNCDYCFFLKKEKLYPGSNFRMSDDVMESYIRQTIEAHAGPQVTIAWQGGEPTLMGLDFFRRSVELQKKYQKTGTQIENTFQTNGILLNDDWCEFFRENNFLVGLSLDGPRKLHNFYRKDKGGHGTFDRVVKAAWLLQKNKVEFNILCTVNRKNADHPLEVYRFFRDGLGTHYIQFIPIVERINENGETGFQEGNRVTDRSVRPDQWGRFLVKIFDEWVKRDVGRTFVLNFDGALAGWLNMAGTVCIFGPTCGLGMALEHNGDLYSCDHFVEPNYYLGNILKKPMIELVASGQQRKFGRDKRDTLPQYCRQCEVLHICNGECPKNRLIATPDGEPGLNYLCEGYKAFFKHADRPMKIMADLIQRGRLAEEVMKVLGTEDEAGEPVSIKPGRNEPCFCGSGVKFKKCHGKNSQITTDKEETMKNETLSEQEAYEIGVEAYTYHYPLVLMDATRRLSVNVEAGKIIGRGPMNTFTHVPVFPPADFRDVVRPNFDTLYSIAWLDLTKEPMVVAVPNTQGRYYMLPMLDMWTDVFACPGKRTTGTEAGRFAIVPPGWQGKLPEGVERIDAPTPYVWIIGRTQTNGPKDYDAVHKVQSGYTITPLSQLGRAPQPVTATIDPTVDMKTPPMTQVDNMAAGKYFAYAAELLKVNPPHITDQPIVARMRRIGITVGKSFDIEKADPAVKSALERAAPDALKAMRAKIPTLARVVNGWQMNTDTMGVYGNYYLKRAIVALVGLGANLPEDAVYPLNIGDADGKPLTGSNKYVLHFAKDEIPPAAAFWSVTLYDKDGFPTANALNRYAIGDRDALKFNADGSLDLYLQHASPGAEKESNWLPAPTGDFNLTMRLYAPKTQALDGRWAPPTIKRVN